MCLPQLIRGGWYDFVEFEMWVGYVDWTCIGLGFKRQVKEKGQTTRIIDSSHLYRDGGLDPGSV